VLTGSARLTQEAQDQAAQMLQKQEIERRQLELKSNHQALEAHIASLLREFEMKKTESLRITGQEQAQGAQLAQGRLDMGLSREEDVSVKHHARRGK